MCARVLALLFAALLFASRRAIQAHHPTVLSSSTHFLWAEYTEGCFWFEPLNHLRKLALTGFVLLIPESAQMSRLLVAQLLTLSFLVAMQVGTPYRHRGDATLFTLSQVPLLPIPPLNRPDRRLQATMG